ncbi:MAG: DUF3592 domain-containing protein [Candidatus Melainabacteria bacterium]|nr:DUF3592 domain-containing protein [Candidatus Melainabacteria bacterium]
MNTKFNLLLSPQGASIFGALGVISLCVSAYFFYLASEQSKWVGTYARVTDGAVVHFGRRPYFYKVRLQYKYAVEGKDYQGECELSPQNTRSVLEANSILANYIPNGRALEIYFDPRDPKNSQGNKAEPNLRAWQFLVGGVLSLLAAFVINSVSSGRKLR